MAQAGIKLIATGDITDDGVLEAMGEPTLGLITSFHYSAAHKSPENAAFKKAYAEVNGDKLRPNFMAAAGYDGMAVIYEALKKTGGSTDGDKLVAAMKGMKLDEPARADHDRSGDARRRADGVHPQGREDRRRPVQRRVRQIPGPEGPGEVTRMSESKTQSVAAIGDIRVIPANAGIPWL